MPIMPCAQCVVRCQSWVWVWRGGSPPYHCRQCQTAASNSIFNCLWHCNAFFFSQKCSRPQNMLCIQSCLASFKLHIWYIYCRRFGNRSDFLSRTTIDRTSFKLIQFVPVCCKKFFAWASCARCHPILPALVKKKMHVPVIMVLDQRKPCKD